MRVSGLDLFFYINCLRGTNNMLIRFLQLGEGHFDESAKASGAATPIPPTDAAAGGGGSSKKKKGMSKKAKTAKQRLAVADGEV